MVIAATQAYYSAAAQVIPILLLVLAIGEARYRSRKPRRSSLSATIGGFLYLGGLLVLGELAALRALINGHDSQLLQNLTAFGLSFGISWVVLVAAAASVDDFGAEGELRRRQNKFLMLILAAVFVVSFAFLGDLGGPLLTLPF